MADWKFDPISKRWVPTGGSSRGTGGMVRQAPDPMESLRRQVRVDYHNRNIGVDNKARMNILDRIEEGDLSIDKLTGRQKHLLQSAGIYQSVKKQIKEAEYLQKKAEGKGVKGWMNRNLVGDSLLARTFDIISRPGQMGAGFVRGLTQPGDGFSAGEGVGGLIKGPGEVLDSLKAGVEHGSKGLWGTEKDNSGSTILKENTGLRGKPATVYGFGLDLATDPSILASTGSAPALKKLIVEHADTLVGKELLAAGAEARAAGLTKGAARQRMQALIKSNIDLSEEGALKATREYAEKNLKPTPGALAKASNEAASMALTDAKAAGKTISKDAIREVRDKATKAVRDDLAETEAKMYAKEKAARSALHTTNEIQFKYGGKVLASSEKLGKVTGGVGKAMRNAPGMGKMAEVFRTDALIGKRLHTMASQWRNVRSTMFEKQLFELRDIYSGKITEADGTVVKIGRVTRKDRKDIAYAIDEGKVHTLSPKNQRLASEAKRIQDQIWDSELDVGLHTGLEKQDDYLYKSLRSDPHTGAGSPFKPGQGKPEGLTLRQAKEAGARPVEDIADILAHRLAKSHRMIAEKTLYDDVANNFSLVAGKNKSTDALIDNLLKTDQVIEASDIYGKGSHVYFDKDVAASMANLHKVVTNDEATKAFFSVYDRALSKWKFGIIGLNPGAQFRNLMGDVFVNTMDGVTNPHKYDQAMRLVSDMYDDVRKPLTGLMEDGVTPNIGKGGVRVKISASDGDHILSGQDIINTYEAKGLRTGFFHNETNIIPNTHAMPVRKAGDFIRKTSEKREDFTRIAHFIDAMEKEAKHGGTLDEIAERAAMRVKKYNFDYNDLTHFERTIMRRVIPFYTYLRKNMPLMLETLATRPGRMAIVPKADQALQQLIGGNANEEVFPGGIQSVFPQWITESNHLQLREGDWGTDPLFLQPDLPINQLQEYFGGFNEGITPGVQGFGAALADQASPLPVGAVEYSTGKDLVTGAEKDPSALNFIWNQIPLSTIGASTVSGDDATKSVIPYTVNGKIPPELLRNEKFINFITGAGLRQVTPNRADSELRRREDIVQGIRARLEAERDKKRKERRGK